METVISLQGHGAEICIGLISRENANRLVAAGEECNEELLTEVIGASWFEVSDIWHFCGPYSDATISDENENQIGCGNFVGDVAKLRQIDPLAVHRMCDEITDDDLAANCLLVTVSPERGDWGQLIVDDGFDIQKLEVVQFSPDCNSSLTTALGYVIDGQPVYWERANNTEVNSPSFAVVDPTTNSVMVEFG